MPTLQEPVEAHLRSELRGAVLELRAAGGRGRAAPVLHLGRPGGPSARFRVPDDALDHGVRCDVVAALLRQCDATEPPLTWLTRTGELQMHDEDAAWLAAAAAAHGEAGVPLTMVVVTRQGWWDPRSDVRQAWRRLRRRSSS